MGLKAWEPGAGRVKTWPCEHRDTGDTRQAVWLSASPLVSRSRLGPPRLPGVSFPTGLFTGRFVSPICIPALFSATCMLGGALKLVSPKLMSQPPMSPPGSRVVVQPIVAPHPAHRQPYTLKPSLRHHHTGITDGEQSHCHSPRAKALLLVRRCKRFSLVDGHKDRARSIPHLFATTWNRKMPAHPSTCHSTMLFVASLHSLGVTPLPCVREITRPPTGQYIFPAACHPPGAFFLPPGLAFSVAGFNIERLCRMSYPKARVERVVLFTCTSTL